MNHIDWYPIYAFKGAAGDTGERGAKGSKVCGIVYVFLFGLFSFCVSDFNA